MKEVVINNMDRQITRWSVIVFGERVELDVSSREEAISKVEWDYANSGEKIIFEDVYRAISGTQITIDTNY